jgi:hypothetical protein
MPIAAGEYIGVDTVRDDGGTHASTIRAAFGSSAVSFAATLPDGGSPQTGVTNSDLEGYVQATVEPDEDHDRFGDETQDQCPGSAGSQGGCPPQANPPPPNAHKKKCKKKHKKHGKHAHAAKKKRCHKKHKRR